MSLLRRLGILVMTVLWGGALLASARDEANGASRVKGEFALMDARTGKAVASKQLRGKVQLVFFGFTHCALTCPVGLSRVRDTLKELGPDAARVAAIFITTDPERDTAQVMRDYVANFGPEIIPLVGGKKAIAKAMRSFRLEAEKTAIKSGDDYQMDHPAIFYLLDGQGHYVTTLPSNGDPPALAKQIRVLLQGLTG